MPRTEALRERLAANLGPAWLAGQRWFRAKQRRVLAVEPHDLAPLGNGHDSWLAVVSVRYADGGEDRYLVPLVVDAHAAREPRDGEDMWRSLARLMVEGGELAGGRGAFVFSPEAAAAALLPSGADELAELAERRLGVEQSNTSVVLGDRLILKLYRCLEPGENPDVEVGSFLTHAGFAHTPPVAGSASYLADDRASCAAAMLQAFLASHGDGWAWLLEQLDEADGSPQLADGLSAIGVVTAEMHAALASRPDDPAFPARAATTFERAAWRAGAEEQLSDALEMVGQRERGRLERLAPEIRRRFGALEDAGEARTSRVHGDYHLGQLLRTDDGFAVIDFEGEPARPLDERRRPSSPLRDVAGMLRSLDYAARTHAARSEAFDADGWLRRARGEFLSGYGGVAAADEALLTAFEIEKACYEVRYEAGNRPDWTWLPLAALERLAA